MNKVILIGNVLKDTEQVIDGKLELKLITGHTKTWDKAIHTVVFNNPNTYFKKSQKIFVEGRLEKDKVYSHVVRTIE